MAFAALCLGTSLAIFAWPALQGIFSRPVFRQSNYRGRDVATAGGLVLVVAVVVGEVVLTVAGRYGGIDPYDLDARRAVVAAVVGFGLLGLLDDLAGDTSTTGYRGHLRALARGEVTTGVLKILGGGVVALIAVAMAVEGEPLLIILVDAAIVALTANLANLFDRRPGRVLKVTVLAGLALAILAGWNPALAGTMLVTGAAIGLLVPDLREELMVGDTGANPMGAAIGLGVVIVAPTGLLVLWLALVLALNLASERVSFTEVIARTTLLRRLDEWGREPRGEAVGGGA